MKKLLIGVLALAASFAAQATVYRAGLKGGFINSYSSEMLPTASFSYLDDVFLGPAAATSRSSDVSSTSYPPFWANNRSWSFKGEMYFDGGTYWFGERMDDMAYVSVDGVQVLSDATWNNFANASVSPAAGWYAVDFRFGNGTGGAGYSYDDDTVKDADGVKTAIGYAKRDSAPAAMSDLRYPADTGSGSLFRVAIAETYFGYQAIEKTKTGYSVTVKSLAPIAMTATVYLGDENGTRSASSSAASLAAGASGTFDIAWASEEVPYVMVALSGSVDGISYWEDSEPFNADNPLVSTVTVSAPARVYESDAETYAFTLTRQAADAWQAVTVNLSYTGDATDFSALPATVAFDIGETEKTVDFTLVDNDAEDGDRTFAIAIAAGEKYVAGSPSSASILIVDDETGAQVCSWTGNGDGVSWDDANNWSTLAVPTKIDTALFGTGVSANLTVTMTGDAVARLVRVETSYEVTLGAARTPSINPMDITIAQNSGLFRLSSDVNLTSGVVYDVGEDVEMRVNYFSGTANITKKGKGKLRFVHSGDNNRTGGTTFVEAGRIEFGANKKTLGSRLEVGGAGESATAYATHASDWNWNPMSGDYVGTFVIKDKGVFDLSANTYSRNFQTMASCRVEAGGLLKLGKTQFLTTGKDSVHFYIEGDVEGSPPAKLNMAASGRFVIPETCTKQIVLDCSIGLKGDYYNGAAYEGGTAWGNRYPRFFVSDIPNVAVDFVLNGSISGQGNGDGFDKRDPGVMRITSSNSYGGKSSNEGMTRVQGGTLLLDNAKTGSATGKSRVEVAGGCTLGGNGRTGGLSGAGNATLNLTGDDNGYATLHPGTIDDATGAHVAGTLNAGSADQACPTAFNNRSKLQISVCARGAVDSLEVDGKVTISGEDNVLDLGVDGVELAKAKGGSYTILSATDGIEGDFATIAKPKSSWQVVKKTSKRIVVGANDEEVEEEYVSALVLNIPSSGLAVVVR